MEARAEAIRNRFSNDLGTEKFLVRYVPVTDKGASVTVAPDAPVRK